MLLRERCGLWGHPEGRYNNEYGNTLKSRMTPMECCLYLGIRNTFMVPCEWEVSQRQYNKAFKTLRSVGWGYNVHKSCDSGKLEEALREAADFPNVTAVALDDFKSRNLYKNYPLEELHALHDRLHNNPVRRLNSWMILYTFQIGNDPAEDAAFQPYMDAFDGIILWTWKEKDVHLIPEKFELFKSQTPKNRRMMGVYLYNFGENKRATPEAVQWQLDFCLDKMHKGEIEGIVFHTNTMADLDFEEYEVAVRWMEQHGDEILPEL